MVQFRLIQRDGFARIGELQLGSKFSTPMVIDAKHPQLKLDLDLELRAKMLTHGYLIHEGFCLIPAGDLRYHPSQIQKIIKLRLIYPELVFYGLGIATPASAALLISSGFDLMDDSASRARGLQGYLLTPDGEFKLQELKSSSQVCGCMLCSQGMDPDLLPDHNSRALSMEISKCIQLLRLGLLREYLEKQAASHPWIAAGLRYLDRDWRCMEVNTPIARRSKLYANTYFSLNRAEIKRFAHRVLNRFRSHSRVILLLPCSSRKPYSLSKSHSKILNSIGDLRAKVQELILSSPLGVVPRELELVYPAGNYDTPVTGDWSSEELEWIINTGVEFVIRNKIQLGIAYLRGKYLEIAKQISDRTGMELNHASNLDQLRNLLRELDANRLHCSRDLHSDIFRSISRYQFDQDVFPPNFQIKGKYPKLRAYLGNRLLATIEDTGLLRLELDLAGNLRGYRVMIQEIPPPGGDVLAPGVIAADQRIRVGDWVAVYHGSRLVGMGRAKMCGYEMNSGIHGVAVELKRRAG